MQNIAYADIINVNREAFLAKVISVCLALEIPDPSYLMVTIYIESKFKRRIVNPTSSAVGLIQWIPRYVAPHLGMNPANKSAIVARIQGMSGIEQLELVRKFLMPYKGRMTDYYQTYLAVFNPSALGKSDSHILGSKNGDKFSRMVYQWNKSLDIDRSGTLTVSDIKKRVKKFIPEIKNTHKSDRQNCKECGRPL